MDRITESDIFDPEREAYFATATCVECGTTEPAAMMVEVRGDEGLCQDCDERFAAEERENMASLNRHLDGLITDSLRGYR